MAKSIGHYDGKGAGLRHPDVCPGCSAPEVSSKDPGTHDNTCVITYECGGSVRYHSATAYPQGHNCSWIHWENRCMAPTKWVATGREEPSQEIAADVKT